MAVIDKQKLWLYGFFNNYYKASTYNKIYLNAIHSMNTHDSASINDAIDLVIGSEELYKGFN